QGTLRLRAASDAERDSQTITQPRVQWAEDVVDNEGMGKKSSKVCCIYHKPRETGESSSEESSSSSDDSDSEPDTSRAQPANRRSAGHRHHRHTSDSEPCEHEHGPADSKKEGKQKERKRSPNAYERVPKRKQ
ncbi:phosphatase inhibitor-domain-containing protein, partial [Delphinella strobiligena]